MKYNSKKQETPVAKICKQMFNFTNNKKFKLATYYSFYLSHQQRFKISLILTVDDVRN